jgi:hypothetical protein
MPLYFIRHGESEANERNQFAGRQDSPLTHLGGEQAEQAGRAIIRKGLVFDEIHVSPLKRARFTAQKIAEVSGNTAAKMYISDALLERHFGFLQGRNKSLWKKVLGYRRYDAMLLPMVRPGKSCITACAPTTSRYSSQHHSTVARSSSSRTNMSWRCLRSSLQILLPRTIVTLRYPILAPHRNMTCATWRHMGHSRCIPWGNCLKFTCRCCCWAVPCLVSSSNSS